ncbi:MAG: hypothetical protein AAF511_01680, partial [Pseudomonadota bacterium]
MTMKFFNDLRLKATLLAVVSPLSLSVSAHAASITQSLNFQTSGQSMYGPDSDGTFDFDVSLLKYNQPKVTFGEINQVNNPARDAWQVVYDGTFFPTYGAVYGTCRLNIFNSHEHCNAVAVADANSAASFVAGTAPSATVAEGATLSIEGHLDSGFRGFFGLEGGDVNVSHGAQATTSKITADVANGSYGVTTTFSNQTTDLHSNFSEVGAELDFYIDTALKSDIEAYLIGVGGKANVIDFDTNGEDVFNILDINLSEDGLSLSALESDPLTVLDEGYRSVLRNGVNGGFASAGVPVGEVNIRYPDLDQSASGTGPDGVTAYIEPADRLAAEFFDANFAPEANSDFLKLELDIDGLAQTPLGASGQIGTFPVLMRAEVNALDFDLSSYFAFEQKLDFDPDLQVEYIFSEPVYLEIAPGVYAETPVSSYLAKAGEEVLFKDPGTPGFTVTPVYTLANNSFQNLTDIELDFALETDWFQFILDGLFVDLLGMDFAFSVLSTSLPLNGDSIQLGRLGGANGYQFSLHGFDDITGASLA